VKHNIC